MEEPAHTPSWLAFFSRICKLELKACFSRPGVARAISAPGSQKPVPALGRWASEKFWVKTHGKPGVLCLGKLVPGVPGGVRGWEEAREPVRASVEFSLHRNFVVDKARHCLPGGFLAQPLDLDVSFSFSGLGSVPWCFPNLWS